MDIEQIQEKLEGLEFDLQEGLWEISNGDIGMPFDKAVELYYKNLEKYIHYSKMLRESKLKVEE